MPEAVQTQIDAIDDRLAQMSPDLGRAGQARALLDNQILQAAFANIEAQIFAGMRAISSSAHTADERGAMYDRLGQKLQTLEEIKRDIESYVDTGKLVELEQVDLRSKRDVLRDIRG